MLGRIIKLNANINMWTGSKISAYVFISLKGMLNVQYVKQKHTALFLACKDMHVLKLNM